MNKVVALDPQERYFLLRDEIREEYGLLGNVEVEMYRSVTKEPIFLIDGKMADMERAKKLLKSLQSAIEYVENYNWRIDSYLEEQ